MRDRQGGDSCRYTVVGDDAAAVVSALNDARREPLKFSARTRVRLVFENGSSHVVSVNGDGLKDATGTYRADANLEEKLHALAEGRCRDSNLDVVSRIVSVCELIADPSWFDGARVAVRGTYTPHYHGALLLDESCGLRGQIAVCFSRVRMPAEMSVEDTSKFAGVYIGRFYQEQRCRILGAPGWHSFAIDSVVSRSAAATN